MRVVLFVLTSAFLLATLLSAHDDYEKAKSTFFPYSVKTQVLAIIAVTCSLAFVAHVLVVGNG